MVSSLLCLSRLPLSASVRHLSFLVNANLRLTDCRQQQRPGCLFPLLRNLPAPSTYSVATILLRERPDFPLQLRRREVDVGRKKVRHNRTTVFNHIPFFLEDVLENRRLRLPQSDTDDSEKAAQSTLDTVGCGANHGRLARHWITVGEHSTGEGRHNAMLSDGGDDDGEDLGGLGDGLVVVVEVRLNDFGEELGAVRCACTPG